MARRDALAKVLAIVGTLLVVLPIVAPLAFGLSSIGRPGGFRMDYLMPFEAYPVTLVGIALLVLASFRARARKRPVGILIAVMLGALVLGAVAARVTGIATSVEQLETWRYVVVAGFGVVSLVAQAVLVLEGFLLVRDLFAPPTDAAPPATPVTSM